MRVLFVYPNTTQSWQVQLGIAYLSSVLEMNAINTSLLDLTSDSSEVFIRSSLKTHNFDLLAISCTTLSYSLGLRVASIAKEMFPDLPIVMGGSHVTSLPDQVANESSVDAVCVGEGEYALLDFITEFEKKGEIPTDIKNFYVKRDGRIHRNVLRPLIQNLDTLPFPNRAIFDKRHIENEYPMCAFLTSRGCPFQCSMCINHYLQRLYKGLGAYTRFRTLDNVFAEIQEVKRKYNVKGVFFVDDTFTLNKKRLDEFCKRYHSEIDLPFIIMGRCNTVTRQLIFSLKRAGCIQIGFGVESGNEFIRNTILHRGMSEKQILNAFQWCREAKMKTASYNMIGIPFETREKIFDTIMLNRKIKPDIVQVTLLYPFPKTDIYELAQKEGVISNRISPSDYYSDGIVNLPTLSKRELRALRDLFPLYVHLPSIFKPFLRILEYVIHISKLSKLVKYCIFILGKLRE